MSENIYYCSNCGGVMEFDVKTQSLKCPNCDTQVNIVNDKKKIIEHEFNKRVAKTIAVEEKQTSTMECKGCGAKVEVSPDCTATECPYCGSKYVLAEKQEAAIVPDGIVPFKVDKHKVQETFNKWINRRWLAPGKLKHLYESGKIQGVYIPYWTFDADVVCDYSAEGGKHRKVEVKKDDGTTETRTETDWYNTHGRVKEFFDDVQVRGSKNLKDSLLKGIEPYDTKKQLVSYSPEYLSGYGAECYTVSLEDAHREANSIMETELRELARKDVRKHYDEVRNVRIAPDYRDETYKHILIPVYSTAFTYANKNYTVLVNGQTGKIKGSYPKSPIKIGIIVAIIAAIVALLIALNMKCKNNSDNSVYGNGTETGYSIESTYDDSQYLEMSDYEYGIDEDTEIL
ncbi:MAG: hypothetical protein SOV90_03935 [Lachnospiraceae bacterium]|nr:hypothetical protein [Clostridiales bacterium]MDY2607066.1 hypothetical protein [Lachnospiraceae bacterium]